MVGAIFAFWYLPFCWVTWTVVFLFWVVRWLLGWKLQYHKEGADGVPLCRELLVAQFTAVGAMVGIKGLQDELIDVPTWWALLFVTSLTVGGMVYLLQLRKSHDPDNADFSMHFYNHNSVRLFRIAIPIVLVAMGILWIANRAGAIPLQARAESQAIEVVDAFPALYADGTVGIQALVAINVSTSAYSELELRSELIEGAESRWMLMPSNGYVGGRETIGLLLKAEEEEKSAVLKASGEQGLTEKLANGRLMSDLTDRQLGNSESQRETVRSTSRLLMPMEPGATKAVIYLDKLPVGSIVVVQVLFYPKNESVKADEDELSGFKTGKYFRVTDVNRGTLLQ